MLPYLVYAFIRRKRFEAALIVAEIGRGMNGPGRAEKPTQAKPGGTQKIVGNSGKVYTKVSPHHFLNPASQIKKR